MIKTIKNTWNRIKTFFKNSEAIFVARMTALSGLVVSAMGSIDWSPLLSLDFSNAFSWTQATWIGFCVFMHGLVSEIARRFRATDL